MKIKFNNLLDNYLNNTKDAKSSVKTRNGFNEHEEKKYVKQRQGIKIVTSLVLLLALTVSLDLKGKIGYDSKASVENKIYAKAVDSVAAFSPVDSVDEESVYASKYEEKLIFSVPLSGQIQKMYSKDKVIYSKTLNKWKTHEGIDVSANLGEVVKSMEKGKVDEIYYDAMLGNTIVISHIAGYKSVYSNLDESVYVNVGETVEKGQMIGRVGNSSKSEAKDEPHLHLSVYLGDESVDPTYIYN